MADAFSSQSKAATQLKMEAKKQKLLSPNCIFPEMKLDSNPEENDLDSIWHSMKSGKGTECGAMSCE